MTSQTMNLDAAMELADHASPAPASASLALKALRREIELLRAALAERDEPVLLRVLADIRWACGDRGKRMQPELVEHIRDQAKNAERYCWLRNRAITFERDEGRIGTPYCVYGLGMGDAEPTYGSELDAMVDDAKAIDDVTRMQVSGNG